MAFLKRLLGRLLRWRRYDEHAAKAENDTAFKPRTMNEWLG